MTVPANDDFADATVFALNGGFVTGNTDDATVEDDEPVPYGLPITQTVWYKITGPSTAYGDLELTTAGSNFDTILAAYYSPDGSFANLELLEASDDAGEGLYSQFTVLFNPREYGTYYIQLGGYGGSTGNYQLISSFTPLTPPVQEKPVATKKKKRLGIEELPFSFIGGRFDNEQQRRLQQQLQANNDHMMGQMRKMAKHLNAAEDAITALTKLVQSTEPT